MEAKKYVDSLGCKYMVMPGIGSDTFKARYQKPDKQGADGWKCVRSLPWRSSFDEAQTDLDLMARKKGWQIWI